VRVKRNRRARRSLRIRCRRGKRRARGGSAWLGGDARHRG